MFTLAIQFGQIPVLYYSLQENHLGARLFVSS